MTTRTARPALTRETMAQSYNIKIFSHKAINDRVALCEGRTKNGGREKKEKENEERVCEGEKNPLVERGNSCFILH